jgi:hypothetical protein
MEGCTTHDHDTWARMRKTFALYGILNLRSEAVMHMGHVCLSYGEKGEAVRLL